MKLRELVIVLNNFCDVNGEFPETGTSVFLHNPAWSRGDGMIHGRQTSLVLDGDEFASN